jgi:hypothetical protein
MLFSWCKYDAWNKDITIKSFYTLLSITTGHYPVRCHVTQPLDSDRWSFCLLGHRTVRWCTGHPLFTVRCAIWLCSDSGAHCSAFNAFCRRPLARSSSCSAGTPDSPVRHRIVQWIIAEGLPEFPKVSSSELESLVQRTLPGGAPDTVRWCTGQSGAPDQGTLWLTLALNIWILFRSFYWFDVNLWHL